MVNTWSWADVPLWSKAPRAWAKTHSFLFICPFSSGPQRLEKPGGRTTPPYPPQPLQGLSERHDSCQPFQSSILHFSRTKYQLPLQPILHRLFFYPNCHPNYLSIAIPPTTHLPFVQHIFFPIAVPSNSLSMTNWQDNGILPICPRCFHLPYSTSPMVSWRDLQATDPNSSCVMPFLYNTTSYTLPHAPNITSQHITIHNFLTCHDTLRVTAAWLHRRNVFLSLTLNLGSVSSPWFT